MSIKLAREIFIASYFEHFDNYFEFTYSFYFFKSKWIDNIYILQKRFVNFACKNNAYNCNNIVIFTLETFSLYEITIKFSLNIRDDKMCENYVTIKQKICILYH